MNSLSNDFNTAISKKDFVTINALLKNNNINFKKLDKPYKVTDSYINELGSPLQLSKFIFSLKARGQYIPMVLNFDTKNVIVRFISKRVPDVPSKDELLKIKKEMASQMSQEFYQNSQEEILKQYKNDGKIKVNPILNTGT